MADSKFWRFLALALVVSVFYVGHGLHDSAGPLLPDLETQLHAGDVATATHQSSSRMKIVTSSEDGRSIHIWSASTTGDGVSFVGSFPAVKSKRK